MINWAEHVKNAYEISIVNLERKRAHGIPWRGFGWKHMGWILMLLDKNQWLALV